MLESVQRCYTSDTRSLKPVGVRVRSVNKDTWEATSE